MPYLGYEFLRVVKRRTNKQEDCLAALFRKADNRELKDVPQETKRSYKKTLSLPSLQQNIVWALTSETAPIDNQADLSELIKGFNHLKSELENNPQYKKYLLSCEKKYSQDSIIDFQNKTRVSKYKNIDFDFKPIPMNE